VSGIGLAQLLVRVRAQRAKRAPTNTDFDTLPPMANGHEKPAAQAPSWRKHLPWLAIPVAIGGMAAIDIALKGWPATKCANAFVAAVRQGRLDDARALATPDLGERLNPSDLASGSELARAYERMRVSTSIEGGFIGYWTEGCMTGSVPGVGPLWVVMSKRGSKWLVSDLRIETRPKQCEPEAGE
jgi:hypothetical protein